MDALAAALSRLTHESVAGPHASLEYEGRLVAVSRYVDGVSLRETLVQTGRLTASDVSEIGRQVLSGLAALESVWPAHGDIRIANLRLTEAGTACLVNCGVSVAAGRRFIVHHALRPDRCDTVAPELIGTDRLPDALTDLYAVGCLLWQLLCGRPPFPFADPLDKLAAHQTQTVPDVREIAPDVPQWMADAIAAMTSPDRTQRPPSFSDASRRWQQAPGVRVSDGGSLSRFSPRVREMARRSTPPRSAARWMLAATLLLSVSGAALAVSGLGRSNPLLHLSRTVMGGAEDHAPESQAHKEPELFPLPAPDPKGIVRLPHAGPWRAGVIGTPGPLVIRGSAGQPAVVQVNEPLSVEADSLVLEHVILQGTSTVLLDCTSRNVRLSHCGMIADTETPAVGLVWRSSDLRDRSAGTVTVTDSAVHGLQTAIRLDTPARHVNLGNVLVTRCGTAIRQSTAARPGATAIVRLLNVTARDTRHVFSLPLPDTDSALARVDVELGDSVFDLRGTGASVFELTGPEVSPLSRSLLQCRGRRGADVSLLCETAKSASWTNSLSGVVGPLPDGLVQTEDLLASPLRFRDRASLVSRDSELLDFEAPRQSSAMPGIRASQLPPLPVHVTR